MTIQQIISSFCSIPEELQINDANNYVSLLDRKTCQSALNKLNQFLVRYESNNAMRNYYASYGVGASYYSNAQILEGALIDAIQ